MSLQAFDLVPAIERIRCTEKFKTGISCLDCLGKDIFIATTESFLIYYILQEKKYENGRVVFNAETKNQKYFDHKPITMMKAVRELRKLMILCDGNLVILNIAGLEVCQAITKLKGISCFCINEKSRVQANSVEVCVAKNKKLQIYHISHERIIHIRDVATSESVITMSMGGHYVCAALKTKYVIVDTESADIQDLFPHQDGVQPLIKPVTEEEFLLSGPSGLGMFVTTGGISCRPPLAWGENILSIAYYHPYLIVLSSSFLTVYNILDQQPKQHIRFSNGCYVDNFDGKILVASTDVVCALLPVPWEKQVQFLLNDKKVYDALELARHNSKNNTHLSKEHAKKILQNIQQQAGFIELSLLQFNEAKDLFHESQLDIRELISLFPHLLPSNSSFSRTSPALHSISNVQDMCMSDKVKVSCCFDFLLEYLEEVRGTPEAAGFKLEIDTALLKLYAERNSSNLLSFITSMDLGCNPKEGVECLQFQKRYHALATFHSKLGENEKALAIWAKLVTGDYSDSVFPGLAFMVNFLCSLSDHLLVWKYVDFVLERDETLGLKVFINRPDEVPSERMRPELITEYLHRFPTAMVLYLEYLVFEKKLEKESFHTHLAVLYLDRVLHILKLPEHEQTDLAEARRKLQFLLQSSTLYRVQLLLGKAQECQLYVECAILYGKLEEHEEALRILIHKLQDHAAAEDYCIQMSKGKELKFRHNLFHKLLGLYLDPNMNEDQLEDMVAPAVQLLNSDLAEFDVAKVLQLIPPHWSVAIIDQFLNKALRSTLHRCYFSHIRSALSRGVNLKIRFQKISLESSPIIMTEDRLCSICKRPFLEPVFVQYPNGLVTHPQCAKQNMTCPDSGQTITFQTVKDTR